MGSFARQDKRITHIQ